MGYVEGTSGGNWRKSQFSVDFVSMRDFIVGWEVVEAVAGAWTGTQITVGTAETVYINSRSGLQVAESDACVADSV
jgi:hypothetical protein